MVQRYELLDLYRLIDPNASVLDVGCFGFGQQKLSLAMGLTGIKHFGVDYNDYKDIPLGFVYRKADLNQEPLPFEDDSFDLVVASHVLEHIAKSVKFFGECVRVCKPGGYLYIATPSERSQWLSGMPFAHDSFFSLSFYDDPTHIGRPWSPQSLHRLARYYQCIPLASDYQTFSLKRRILGLFLIVIARLRHDGKALERNMWGVIGWSSYLAAQKPVKLKGKPSFVYYIPSR